MSHFVRIRTRLREREALVAALKEMRVLVHEGERLRVRGWEDNREVAEVVVDTGTGYDIGFRRRRGESEYECVADWWGIEAGSGFRQEAFLQQLNQQYAYRVVLKEADEQDMLVVEEEVLENGDRVVVLSERG